MYNEWEYHKDESYQIGKLGIFILTSNSELMLWDKWDMLLLVNPYWVLPVPFWLPVPP